MLLIQNGYVIDPKSGREGVMDILVKDKRIEKMEQLGWKIINL